MSTMDITKILTKLTDNMQKIYINVNKIVNEQDHMVKTNEEDLIFLVEAIEELKIVINKKKEQLKCPLFKDIKDNIKEVSEKLQNSGIPSSISYKINHNLPENSYGGVKPFEIKPSRELEENKVGNIIDPMMNIKEESKPFINDYPKNIEGLEAPALDLFNPSSAPARPIKSEIFPSNPAHPQNPTSTSAPSTTSPSSLQFLHLLSTYT